MSRRFFGCADFFVVVVVGTRHIRNSSSLTKSPHNIQFPTTSLQVILARIRGRPAIEPIEDSSDEETAPPQKRKCVIVPDATRYDHTNDFPDMVEKAVRRRCRMCSSQSQVICLKCDVVCFQIYHPSDDTMLVWNKGDGLYFLSCYFSLKRFMYYVVINIFICIKALSSFCHTPYI